MGRHKPSIGLIVTDRRTIRRDCTTDRPARQGAVLVAVLVCMAVALGLVGNALRCTLAARRAVKSELQYSQAHWLLEAAVDRAKRLPVEQLVTGLETWDASSAFTDFSIATATTSLLDEPSGKSDSSVRMMTVMVKLGHSDQPAGFVTLERTIRVVSGDGTE